MTRNLENIAEQVGSQIAKLAEDESAKVLGLRWLAKADQMAVSVNMDGVFEADTKRKMLSIIASIYDPNGFIAPIVVVAKIMMQDLWRLDKLKWDDKLPPKMIDRRKEF